MTDMTGPDDITVQLAGLFDNPPPEYAEPTTVFDAWDADDDQFESSIIMRAETPSSGLSASELVDRESMKRLAAEDPVTGGVLALDGIRSEWDWDMTPGQRARKVSDVAFTERVGRLVDEFTKAAARPFPDPSEYAAEVLMRRRA